MASGAAGAPLVTSTDVYLEISWETYYDSYFQEMASESLIGRWQRINNLTVFLVASTASGSAIAGWALWSAPGWKLAWAAIAGIATLASIGHGVMGIPERVKKQGEFRRGFSVLRVDTDTYRQRLKAGLSGDDAKNQHERLRERYSKLFDAAPTEVVYTKRFRTKIQDSLDDLLRQRGEAV